MRTRMETVPCSIGRQRVMASHVTVRASNRLSGRVFVDQDGGRAVGVPVHAGAVLDPGHIGHCGAMMCSVSVTREVCTVEVSQCRAWLHCCDAGVTVPLNLVGQAVVPRKVTPSSQQASHPGHWVADQSHSPLTSTGTWTWTWTHPSYHGPGHHCHCQLTTHSKVHYYLESLCIVSVGSVAWHDPCWFAIHLSMFHMNRTNSPTGFLFH